MLRLLLAYNGAGFRGFALNPGVPTVAGVLTEALERALNQEISLVCAGRTDAGVHAWGQVVSFEVMPPDSKSPDYPAVSSAASRSSEITEPGEESREGELPKPLLDMTKLRDSLNKMCGPEIAVREAEWAADDFDARRSAAERTYRYRIHNHPVINPFTADATWHIPAPLSTDAMNQAAQHILGEHDFTSFCRKAEERSLVRRVNRAVWFQTQEYDVDETVLEIAASSFCHQMVRSLVGTFAEIGQGKRPPEAMAEILAAENRQAAANLAPPQGLCLWHVAY